MNDNDNDNYKDSKTDDFVDIDIKRARMLQGYCSSLSCTELTDSPNLEDFNISRKNVIVFFVVETVISLRSYYVISLNGDHLGSAFLDCQNKDKISYRKERVKYDALDVLLFIILF